MKKLIIISLLFVSQYSNASWSWYSCSNADQTLNYDITSVVRTLTISSYSDDFVLEPDYENYELHTVETQKTILLKKTTCEDDRERFVTVYAARFSFTLEGDVLFPENIQNVSSDLKSFSDYLICRETTVILSDCNDQ